jgi:hypothetical protein
LVSASAENKIETEPDMPSYFRHRAAKGNEFLLLVDRIFAGWYEPVHDTVPMLSSAAAATSRATEKPVAVAVDRAPENFPEEEAPEFVFHMGDPLPCEVEELKRLGVGEDRIAEMWGRFSPERIAKILGVTVSQVRIASAWSRRTIPVPVARAPVAPQQVVATCAHCGTSHAPGLLSLDHQAVCSEVCQIELNARFEAEHAPHPVFAHTTTIISGSLNVETVRELLVPSQNRLPRDAVAPTASI